MKLMPYFKSTLKIQELLEKVLGFDLDEVINSLEEEQDQNSDVTISQKMSSLAY